MADDSAGRGNRIFNDKTIAGAGLVVIGALLLMVLNVVLETSKDVGTLKVTTGKVEAAVSDDRRRLERVEAAIWPPTPYRSTNQ